MLWWYGNSFSFALKYRVLGTPNEKLWPGVTQLKDYKSDFPKWNPKDLSEVLPELDADGIDLLKV